MQFIDAARLTKKMKKDIQEQMAIIYWSWIIRDKNLTGIIIYAYKLRHL